MSLSAELLRAAHDLVAERLGLDLPSDRMQDLETALASAPDGSPVACDAYLGRLRTVPSDSPEWRSLANALTVGETYFFRDPSAFDALEKRILPDLIAERRSDGTKRLRIWSAGCATGEEPYSLAILLDQLLPDPAEWSVTVLGTDLNVSALDVAQRGFYREWALRTTSPELRERYFRRNGSGFLLNEEIRRKVVFAPLNLAEPVYPDPVTNTTAMDVILCRNVIMYFTPTAQRRVLARLRRALVTRGWLALNAAESSADLLRPLNAVAFPTAIFYRKERTHAPAIPAPFPNVEERPPIVATEPNEQTMISPPMPPPDDGDPLLRARALADAGQLEEAKRLCQLVLGANRLDPSAHVLLAAIHQELGEIRSAMVALRTAIYLCPESPAGHFLLGVLQWRQGERQRGRRSLETAVNLLERLRSEEPLAEAGDLTAGRLREIVLAYLEER